MSLIRINKLKKYYGDVLILDIDKFEMFHGDRIGIVGKNGVGKTTFLKILIGEEEVDEGEIYLSTSYSYVSQMDEVQEDININAFTKIKTPKKYYSHLSGGEKNRFKISSALCKERNLIIADEPTANLDKEGIDEFINAVNNNSSSLLLVSHDRKVLDALCNIIVEIEDGKIGVYKGNYSTYIELKKEEKKRKEVEYRKYILEKERLENAITKKEELRDSIKSVPKRMGNSEARLHRKMGGQKGKKKIDNSIKSIRNRIDHLEVKEKPKNEGDIKIDVVGTLVIKSKFIIMADDIKLERGNKTLVKGGKFNIKNGSKVALIGENGSGKTSLLNDIINKENETISISKSAVFGYFKQDLNILNRDISILDNIKEASTMDETFIRINLSRFGFYKDDVLKKVKLLSGGEQVKVALCKVLLSDNNVLILDEPSNYLDIRAMEALEEALVRTNKTIIMVCHDERLLKKVCNNYVKIEKGIVTQYDNLDSNDNKIDKDIVVKNKLVELISLISLEKDINKKRALELEYNELLNQLK